MRVPMTIADFLDRAELGFADSPGVIDEPGQPAAPVAPSTYGQLGERVRAWQAGLDALGVGE
ncbi:AMP-dependent synthetase, partial [Streptomyces europaeiscabiei]|nr:AMP-dependent synthetase [Streptomyces europaeiscabiei]